MGIMKKAQSNIRKAQMTVRKASPYLNIVKRGASTVEKIAESPLGSLVPASKYVGLVARGVQKGVDLADKFANVRI